MVKGFGTPLLIIAVCLAILYLLAVRVLGDLDDLPALWATLGGHAHP